MTGFADFEELHPPLRLAYRGTEYEVPPVGVNDAVTIAQAFDAKAERPDEDELERVLLGDAGTQMRADNVPPAFVSRVIMTALADFQSGRTVAEMIWETGAQPAAVDAWLGSRYGEIETDAEAVDDATSSEEAASS